MPKHIIVQAKTTAGDGEFGKLVVPAMRTLTIKTRSNDIKLGGHGWPCKDGRDGESGESFAAGRLACPQGLLLRGWNGTRWMMLAVQGSGVRCPHLKAESNWARVMWVVQDLERRGKHAACKSNQREHEFLAVVRSKGAHGSKSKLCISRRKIWERFIVFGNAGVRKVRSLEAEHVPSQIGQDW